MKRTRGLGFVYSRSGGIWWVQYSVRGRRFRESSGSTQRGDAVRLLKKRISEAQAGKAVGPQPERTTLDEMLRMVMDDYKTSGCRSVPRVQFALPHLRAFFGGDARALDITSDRVVAYRAQRQDQGAALGTIAYECATLRRSFRLALDAGKVFAVPKIQTPVPDNARKGFFEREQFRAVVARLPEYLRPLLETAYITGRRTRSELMTRQWRHLDLENGWLRLDPGESKNGEGRMFPLSAELRTVLEVQRERVREIERASGQIVPWIFVHDDGSRIKDFRGSWNKACRVAGVPGRVLHDLRRTAVRNLERAGVPRSAAMKLTGHLTEAVYRRYAIVADRGCRQAGRVPRTRA